MIKCHVRNTSIGKIGIAWVTENIRGHLMTTFKHSFGFYSTRVKRFVEIERAADRENLAKERERILHYADNVNVIEMKMEI